MHGPTQDFFPLEKNEEGGFKFDCLQLAMVKFCILAISNYLQIGMEIKELVQWYSINALQVSSVWIEVKTVSRHRSFLDEML